MSDPIFRHHHQNFLLLFFYFSHTAKCTVVSYSAFNLCFPDSQLFWTVFNVLIDHLYIHFNEVSVCTFVDFLIGFFFIFTVVLWQFYNYRYSRYFQSGMWFANNFFPDCSLCFHSLHMAFLGEKNLLSVLERLCHFLLFFVVSDEKSARFWIGILSE